MIASAYGPGSSTEDTSENVAKCRGLVPYVDEVFVQQTTEWVDLADDGVPFGAPDPCGASAW